MKLRYVVIFLSFASCGSHEAVKNTAEPRASSESNAESQKNAEPSEPKTPPITPPIPDLGAVTEPVFDLGPEPSDYLDMGDVYKLLQKWQERAAPIATLHSYGKAQGYDLQYLRIHAGARADAPKVLIDAATHGDEAISVATVLGVTHRLLSLYGREKEVTDLLKERDIYVVPMVCADGYARGSREVEGQDPNRTFPHPGDPNRRSVQCITALRNLFHKEQFNATIDYHASGRMVLLPWGYTRQRFADGNRAAAYRNLGQKLASLAGYTWGQIPDMVGYTAPGSSVDYFYIEGKKANVNTFSVGIEVGVAKRPARSEIPIEVGRNFPLIIAFLKDAPQAFESEQLTTDTIHWPVPQKISPYFVPGKE